MNPYESRVARQYEYDRLMEAGGEFREKPDNTDYLIENKILDAYYREKEGER